LDIEDGIGYVPLREDCLLWGKGQQFATAAIGGEKVFRVEESRSLSWHGY
jgi:hypothetical protein